MEGVPVSYLERYARYFELIAERVPDDGTVIVIGANEGTEKCPVSSVWRDTWKAYLVEPNPAARAKMKKAGTIVPLAIGEENGELTLWKMTDAAADEFNKRVGDDGSCLTSVSREHIEIRLNKKMPDWVKRYTYDALMERIDVECVTYDTLLKRYGIESVDLVQIDIEGHDRVAAEQALNSWRLPRVMMWEHQHLTAKDSRFLEALALVRGYKVERLRNDTVAYR